MASRYDAARRRGATDEQTSSFDAYWQDYMAKKAEQYVAELLGVQLPRETGKRDPGWDLTYRGRRIDVKWSPYTPGRKLGKDPACPHLIVPTWKPLVADAYVLIMGESLEEFDKYDWAHGWATRQEVAAAPIHPSGRKHKSSGKPSLLHWISFDYLRPMEDLLAIAPRV